MDKCIRLTGHAELRLRERNIERSIVERVLARPERIYYDVLTRRLIYTAWIRGKRLIVVAEEDDCATIVTVIETSGLKLEEKRMESGRWVCVHGC